MPTDPDDEQAIAEAIDEDEVDDVEFPPDAPMGVEDYGVTGAEERIDEPLEERVAREVPDGRERPADVAIGLIDPDGDGPDETAELVGELGDTPDLSAEEAAVHIVDEG